MCVPDGNVPLPRLDAGYPLATCDTGMVPWMAEEEMVKLMTYRETQIYCVYEYIYIYETFHHYYVSLSFFLALLLSWYLGWLHDSTVRKACSGTTCHLTRVYIINSIRRNRDTIRQCTLRAERERRKVRTMSVYFIHCYSRTHELIGRTYEYKLPEKQEQRDSEMETGIKGTVRHMNTKKARKR